jgi:hypothetical protein
VAITTLRNMVNIFNRAHMVNSQNYPLSHSSRPEKLKFNYLHFAELRAQIPTTRKRWKTKGNRYRVFAQGTFYFIMTSRWQGSSDLDEIWHGGSFRCVDKQF